MVRVRNFFLVAVAAALFSMGNTVNAGVVFDNLNSVTSPGVPPLNPNPDPLSGDGPQYASFSTGDAFSGLTLSDVKLLLSSSNTNSDKSFTVSLVSGGPTVGGNPGPNISDPVLATLGTFSDGFLNSTPTVFEVSGLSVALAANTRYWIQLSGSASSLLWSFAKDDTGVGILSEYSAYYNGGGYTSAPFIVTANTDLSAGGPYQMQVTTVPEPGTFSLTLSALGLGIIGIARRRMTRPCYGSLAKLPIDESTTTRFIAPVGINRQ